MEIYQLSVQIPATPLRFGRHCSPKFTLRRAQTLGIHRCAAAAVKLHSPTEESVPKSPNRMFVLGMGFVGEFFAGQLKNQGWDVHGTCTSSGKKKKLDEKGFHVHIFDANEPELSILNTMKCCTHLLVSVPTVAGIGDPMLQHGELLRRTLVDGDLKWLSYLSSTSVYGDYGGAWVDEDSQTNPMNESAKMRLVAETGWLKLGEDLGLSAHVFRLGGIYGPGRSAVDTIIKQGSVSNSQKMRVSRQYTSRVHVEDICQALKASIVKPTLRKQKNSNLTFSLWVLFARVTEVETIMNMSLFRSVYNIVDDNPAPREEVFAYAWDLIDKKWPGQIPRSTHAAERSGLVIEKRSLRGEKRVSNARMKNELGVRLLHPSYKSGLRSIIHQIDNPI